MTKNTYRADEQKRRASWSEQYDRPRPNRRRPMQVIVVLILVVAVTGSMLPLFAL